jgi:serine/threonine-protein kinase RsbW
MLFEEGAVHEEGRPSPLLDIEVRGEASAIAAATDTVSDVLIGMACPEETRFEIELAVQEALANAVVHGCKNDPSKLVHCRLERHPNGRILIVVSDPGEGFLPEEVLDPKAPENIHRSHGRGVYMICQLMDDVHFHSNGSELHMWKYLEGSEPSSEPSLA